MYTYAKIRNESTFYVHAVKTNEVAYKISFLCLFLVGPPCSRSSLFLSNIHVFFVFLSAERAIALHFLNTLSKTTQCSTNRENTPDTEKRESERSERSCYNQILCDFIRRVEPAYVNISVGWGKIGVEMANTFKMPPKLHLESSPL